MWSSHRIIGPDRARGDRGEIGFHLIGTRKEMELGAERSKVGRDWLREGPLGPIVPIGHVILISPRHNSLGTNVLVCAQIFEARA